MRLWHEDIIPWLPRQQLMGQHRECCALRGHGWARPHTTVNYVFNYSPYKLYQYHLLVMNEMKRRGYKPEVKWESPLYRGRSCPSYLYIDSIAQSYPIYKEHDDNYMKECLDNLAQKGIDISPCR